MSRAPLSCFGAPLAHQHCAHYSRRMTTAVGIRERNRAELDRGHPRRGAGATGRPGAAAVVAGAIARPGMASSAVYRYFPSRDVLLTALIVDAYNSLADQVERSEAWIPRTDLRGTVPGGRASGAHVGIGPRTRVRLVRHARSGYRAPRCDGRAGDPGVHDADRDPGSGPPTGPRPERQATPAERRSLAPMAAHLASAGLDIPPESMLRGIMAWTLIIGAVSF